MASADSSKSKQCVKCLQVRNLLDFHRNKDCSDGHRIICKHCVSAQKKKDYEEARRNHKPPEISEMACNTCGLIKPLEQFGVMYTAKYGRKNHCNSCDRHRSKNREQKRKLCPEYRKKRRYATRRKRFIKEYKITMEQYLSMMDAQKGLCAICGKPEKAKRHPNNEENRDLSVDHCHKTGKVRELLCSNCNKGIGNLQEDISILAKAILYILKHS